MAEISGRLVASEVFEGLQWVEFPAEALFGRERYRAEIHVGLLEPGEVLARPSMENLIRLHDDSGRLVASADDLRTLNHPAAVVANILGNTYPFAEMVVFYPSFQRQSVYFGRELARRGVLGEVSELSVEDKADGRTMPDGFYYDYRGTDWRRRPWAWGTRLIRSGDSFRDDMQFSVVRTPDYRVGAAFVEGWMARDPKERALDFVVALKRYF